MAKPKDDDWLNHEDEPDPDDDFEEGWEMPADEISRMLNLWC